MQQQASYNRLVVVFSVSMTIGMGVWFGFFIAVMLAGLPVFFLFPLLLGTIAAIMSAYVAPLDPHDTSANNQLLFVITMNLVNISVTMCGLLFAVVAASRDHSYVPGVIFAGLSLCIHFAGAIAFVGKSPSLFQKTKTVAEMQQEMRETKRAKHKAKMEDEEEKVKDQAYLRQLKREQKMESALDNYLDEVQEQQIRTLEAGEG